MMMIGSVVEHVSVYIHLQILNFNRSALHSKHSQTYWHCKNVNSINAYHALTLSISKEIQHTEQSHLPTQLITHNFQELFTAKYKLATSLQTT